MIVPMNICKNRLADFGEKALVRLGLESQANRKREFFKRLKDNLAKDDPKAQDRMVDEFRTLIHMAEVLVKNPNYGINWPGGR